MENDQSNYSEIERQKDDELTKFIKELDANPNVAIIDVPKRFTLSNQQIDQMDGQPNCQSCKRIDQMQNGYCPYKYHYAVFYYRGYIVHVGASTHYPFTDENHPGKYNFCLYSRVGLIFEAQESYYHEYNGLRSVDDMIESGNYDILSISEMYPKSISYRIGMSTVKKIRDILMEQGGYREYRILSDSPLFLPTETWDSKHKVVEIIASTLDDDTGHRGSFLFDIVSNKIVG